MDGVGEAVKDAAAQVQAETCGFLAGAAVVSGKAFLKNPGKIIGPYPDACVGDNEGWLLSVNSYGDAALFCVFQGVG